MEENNISDLLGELIEKAVNIDLDHLQNSRPIQPWILTKTHGQYSVGVINLLNLAEGPFKNTNMTAKDFKKQINKELTEILGPFGFKYNAKAYQFIKVTLNGHWGISAGLVNYLPLTVKLSFVFSIRINEVEDIYKSYCRILPESQQFSSTVMISYEYFKEKLHFDYSVSNSEELSIAIKDFENVFERQVLPVLQTFSNLQALSDLVDSGDIKQFDITTMPDNYIHWLIIAKLKSNKDLKGLADFYLEDFWRNNKVGPDIKRVEALLQEF